MKHTVCQKHNVPLEDFGKGGWVEMRCPECWIKYHSPEAANARTKATAARKKRAKMKWRLSQPTAPPTEESK